MVRDGEGEELVAGGVHCSGDAVVRLRDVGKTRCVPGGDFLLVGIHRYVVNLHILEGVTAFSGKTDGSLDGLVGVIVAQVDQVVVDAQTISILIASDDGPLFDIVGVYIDVGPA